MTKFGFLHKLSFLQKLLLVILPFCAIGLLLTPETYEIGGYTAESVCVSYLQAGDYSFTYKTRECDTSLNVIVYSDDTVDSNNQSGGVFLELEAAVETPGTATLHLDKGVHDLRIATTADTDEQIYLSYYKLESIQLPYTDHIILGIFLLATTICLFILFLRFPASAFRIPGILLALGLAACWPLANDILYKGDDLYFHLARLESIYEGLRAGEFPVRIGSVQAGHAGSLSATMYPQLFLYPFAMLRFCGASLMLCYKLLLFAINIGCSFLTYFSLKKMTGSKQIALSAGALYVFSFYRLFCLYQRAALGESLAMIFLPLVICGIYEVLWGDHRKWYLLMLGVSAVLESHILSTEICVIFLVITVIIWLCQRSKTNILPRILAGFKAAVGTCLLNASFLVPFLYFCGEDLQCFHNPYQVTEFLLYPSQVFAVFSHANGDSVSLGSLANEIPLSLGIVLPLGAALFLWQSHRVQEQTPLIRLGKVCLSISLIALFLCSVLCPWDFLVQNKWIYTFACSLQFSWRLLGIASILLSIVGAIGLNLLDKKTAAPPFYLAVGVLLLLTTGYYFDQIPRDMEETGSKMTVNGANATDSMYMYYDGESYKAHNLDYSDSNAYIMSFYEKSTYQNLTRSGSSLSVDVSPSGIEGDALIFPIYCYPGYTITINGVEIEYDANSYRLMCAMPSTDAHVEVHYTGLPIFLFGDLTSLLTCIGLPMICIIRSRWRKHSSDAARSAS